MARARPLPVPAGSRTGNYPHHSMSTVQTAETIMPAPVAAFDGHIKRCTCKQKKRARMQRWVWGSGLEPLAVTRWSGHISRKPPFVSLSQRVHR